jgi:ubiquinone/menaquinone biosynthesis C-methylase UbiE
MDNLEKETSATYNKIADIYHSDRVKNKLFWNEFLEMPATLSLLKNIRNKRILDLGCGSGIYAKLLKSRGAQVYGIDISSKMIDIARANVKGADFRVGSVYNLPYKTGYFDVVVSAFVVEHFTELDAAFKEIRRVLKKNGFFVFSIGNPVVDASHHIKGRARWYRKFDDYFKEGRYNSFWRLRSNLRVKMPWIHRTYQTWIRTIIRNGFVIDDYVDAKPFPSSKKINKRQYEYLSRVPAVCVFKIRAL